MHRPGHEAQLPIVCHVVSQKHGHAHDIEGGIDRSDLQSTEGRLAFNGLKVGQVVFFWDLDPLIIEHEVDRSEVSLACRVGVATVETVFNTRVSVQLF